MMKTAKITEVRLTDYTDQHGNKSANIKFDNGDSGLISFKPDNQPQEGTDFEYEIEVKTSKAGKEYNKIKKYKPPFQKGGYKKPTLSFVDVMRMVRTNAIHAVDVVNANYNEKRLDGNALAVIEKFTLDTISGDIEKFSEEDSLLTSRLASVNNAAIASGYESVKSAADLVKLAESRYKYVTR